MYDVVVLCGGSGRRLGGADKAALEIGGTTLLDRVLLATSTALNTISVGRERPTVRPVRWTREMPAGAGPAAALAAGLRMVTADWTLVLPTDLPYVTASEVTALLMQRSATGTGVVVEIEGRKQWLCSVWPTVMLRTAVADLDLTNCAMHTVLAPLAPRSWKPSHPRAWSDIDTREDLRRAGRPDD